MKQFLAVYTGTPNEHWAKLDKATQADTMERGGRAWHEWMIKHEPRIVVQGGPLGKTKRVDPKGISDTRNELTGYVVIEAESHEAAARLFEQHPHFSIFPGDAVEIMECLPIPA